MNDIQIKWVDRVADEGGGTELTICVNGRIVHAERYAPTRLEHARTVAKEHLDNAQFGNVTGRPPSSV